MRVFERFKLKRSSFQAHGRAGAMSGVDVVRRARALRPGIAVLLTTGYSGSDGSASDEFAILSKPFSSVELRQAIARLIEHARGGDPVRATSALRSCFGERAQKADRPRMPFAASQQMAARGKTGSSGPRTGASASPDLLEDFVFKLRSLIHSGHWGRG